MLRKKKQNKRTQNIKKMSRFQAFKKPDTFLLNIRLYSPVDLQMEQKRSHLSCNKKREKKKATKVFNWYSL